MDTPHARLSLSPALLAAAPHRLLFFVGATNVLAAMAWWALWLVALRWQGFTLPTAPIPAGWGHAFVMSFQLFTPFIFGFLLTVFPRWMDQPALGRWHYMPVGLGLLGGQLLVLIGLWGFPQALHVGVALTLVGWASGLCSLGSVLIHSGGQQWHALSACCALSFGWLALLLFALWLHQPETASLVFASFRIATFAFLLPIYLTVCHRMLPFFASIVVPGYAVWRPMWLLAVMWLLVVAHVVLELMHGYAWLWAADVPLLALGLVMVWKLWPRGPMPGILRVLFIALAWFPAAMALFSAQSLWFAYSGEFALGRAPMHALAIGFFGSMLVAMVTRVTQGHSGRPMAMSYPAWFAFWTVQLVAVMRIASELLPDFWAWQAAAAMLWLVAFIPWVIRSAGIYLSPRADRAPG